MARDETEILAVLNHDGIKGILPAYPDLIIEHLCIGSALSAYSYNSDVSSIGGILSGGGTRTSNYRVFDLGLAVANMSNVSMRVQMVLSKVDREGYTNDTRHVWEDISPGERRRIWAKLQLLKREEFASYVIREIGFAVSQAGVAPYVASTTPNRNVFDLFARKVDALKNNSMMDSMGMSMKAQEQVNVVVGKGIRAYLTYVKWAAIAMGVLLLLGIAMAVVAALMAS